MFINKNVEYHSVNTHDLYKLFTYTDSTYSGSGITINNSIAPQNNTISQTEKTTTYNYNFLKNGYYSIYNSAGFFSYKSSYSKQNNHVLQENARLISIPLRCFGKRIYQGSVSIVDTSTGSFNFTDDGNGNLIDSAISTGSLVSDNTLRAWFSFDDSYIYKEFPEKKVLKLRDSSIYLNSINVINGKFSSGISGRGYKYNLDGTSYAYVNDSNFFDFNKSDFTVSFWLNVPTSQSINTSTTNTILSKKNKTASAYPIEIQLYNTSSAHSGKLLITRQGYKDQQALELISLTSSISLNDAISRHIYIKKESGILKLYINGTLNAATSADYTGGHDASSTSKFFIGVTGDGNNSVNLGSYFSGSIDELRIYSSVIDGSQLYNDVYNTNIIGSIFYEKGLISLNNLSGNYANLLEGTVSNGFTLQYRSVSELTEHEIVIKKGIGEFNMTLNPSIRVGSTYTPINEITSSISNNTFTPYITGIGLYDDKNRLLATAKIRSPIKSINDIDLYFKIRFDM